MDLTQSLRTKSPGLKTVIATAAVASLLLLVANSAVWVHRYVFNSDNFSKTVANSLTSESSRQAIAQDITDRTLANYPIAKNFAGDTMTNAVSGILGSDLVNSSVKEVTERLNIIVTSHNKEPVTINLEGAKGFIGQIVQTINQSQVAQNRQVQISPDDVPSGITLLKRDKLPDFYSYGVVFLWLGPLALIVSLGLLAYPYLASPKSKYKNIVKTQGAALLVAGLLALLVGPMFKPPFLANIDNPQARVVVGNLYNDFVRTFNIQTGLVIAVGAGAIVYSVYSPRINGFIVKERRGHNPQ